MLILLFLTFKQGCSSLFSGASALAARGKTSPDLENKFLKARGEFKSVFLGASVRSCPPSALCSIGSKDVHFLLSLL